MRILVETRRAGADRVVFLGFDVVFAGICWLRQSVAANGRKPGLCQYLYVTVLAARRPCPEWRTRPPRSLFLFQIFWAGAVILHAGCVSWPFLRSSAGLVWQGPKFTLNLQPAPSIRRTLAVALVCATNLLEWLPGRGLPGTGMRASIPDRLQSCYL